MRIDPGFKRCWILFAAILAGLSACSRESDTLTLTLIGEDSANLKAMEAMKQEFETSHHVAIRYVRDPFDVALQKSNQDLANKTGLYDIICQYAASLAPYVNNNYVYTLKDMEGFVPRAEVARSFESDLFPGVWRETGYYRRPGDPEPIAVSYPFAATTMLMVYNKTLFQAPAQRSRYRERYGRDLVPPTTWADYLQLAAFFTDPAQQTFGVAIEGAPGGYLYWEWANYAFGMGGGVMQKQAGWDGDGSTPLILDSLATIAATKLFLSLKPYNAGDFFSVGSAEKREIFLKQPVALAIMWSDYIPELLKAPNAKDFGFLPIPGDKSMLGGATFFLNRASKHPRQATQYILSLLQPKMQVELMTRGLASPLKSVYDDPRVKQISYSAALYQSLERGVYMIESGPDSQIVQDVITDQLQRMWRGTVSVEDGLRTAKTTLEERRRAVFERLLPKDAARSGTASTPSLAGASSSSPIK